MLLRPPRSLLCCLESHNLVSPIRIAAEPFDGTEVTAASLLGTSRGGSAGKGREPYLDSQVLALGMWKHAGLPPLRVGSRFSST